MATTTKARPGKKAAATEAGPAQGSARRYRVHLNCPTPLALNPHVVDARTPEAAKAAFCAANGISGSDHEWDVRLVKGDDDAAHDPLEPGDGRSGARPAQ